MQVAPQGLDAILAAAGWPQSLWPWAEGIVWRESRGEPGVVSWTGEAYGLFQLIPGHFPRCGYPFSEWADPVVNAKVAWCVYQLDGAAPWAVG